MTTKSELLESARILLLDFNPGSGLGHAIQEILDSPCHLKTECKYESFADDETASHEHDLPKIISNFNADLILLILSQTQLKQPDPLFQSIRVEQRLIPVVAVVDAGEPSELFELLKLGASDFITPPLKALDILPRVWRLLTQTRGDRELTESITEKLGFQQLVGESPGFLAVVSRTSLVAKCDVSALISGETGTGKELFARLIHYLSPRASKPFIPVNCGAIPLELVENELFGHERGAFTGASNSKVGLVYEAHGGTLFLDEIDSLPLSAQVKLLRFIQEKEYRPLGSTKVSRVDVRIIAASNVDFEKAVSAGKLRQDLYYRLNVVPIDLPPLRERQEDIPLLARHFLTKYATSLNKPVLGFSLEAMQILVLYDWPGNVRELEHVVERAVVLSEREFIESANIILPRSVKVAIPQSFKEFKANAVKQIEKAYIKFLLFTFRGNITKAAEAARKNRRALFQLIQKHKIRVQDFKLMLDKN